jgi:hypothetical protein
MYEAQTYFCIMDLSRVSTRYVLVASRDTPQTE